ncbi:MAG: transglutaminase-like domain-containing protein [Phycisphaerales bacterium]|nr:transglutaminase-like domain-containing protein [Phycisphaerales bacterium]
MYLSIILALFLGAQATPPAQQQPQPDLTIPQNALKRDAAKLWWMSYDVTIRDLDVPNNQRPFRMPLIMNGPWSEVGKHTLRVASLNGNNEVSLLDVQTAIKGKGLQGESMIQAPVPVNATNFATISVSAEILSFSSQIDEEIAMATPWPAQWPGELSAALQPQALIESDEPVFKETLAKIFGTNLRMNSPYLAAKKIVQYCCVNIGVSGNRLIGNRTAMRGINVSGALATAQSGRGTRADLTCVCVAMLRAAGIPARPVIGLSQLNRQAKEPTTWAEFFLPNSGWVPFSPWEMQNAGVRSWKPERPWRFFGTWKDLKENIALSWSFAPGDGSTAYDAWGIWGWTRSAPWAPFPTPVQLTQEPGRPDNVIRNLRPANISISMTSGGNLSERDYQNWLEGKRRPIRRARNQR